MLPARRLGTFQFARLCVFRMSFFLSTTLFEHFSRWMCFGVNIRPNLRKSSRLHTLNEECNRHFTQRNLNKDSQGNMGSNGKIHPQRLHRFLTIMPCTIRNQAGMKGLIAAGSFNGGFLSGVGDFLKKIGGKLASLQLANNDKMTRRDGTDGFFVNSF